MTTYYIKSKKMYVPLFLPKDHPFSYKIQTKDEKNCFFFDEKNPYVNTWKIKVKYFEGKKGNAIVKVKLLSLPHQLLREWETARRKKSQYCRGKVEQVHDTYTSTKKNQCIYRVVSASYGFFSLSTRCAMITQRHNSTV